VLRGLPEELGIAGPVVSVEFVVGMPDIAFSSAAEEEA
jgi:hypothetical protein